MVSSRVRKCVERPLSVGSTSGLRLDVGRLALLRLHISGQLLINRDNAHCRDFERFACFRKPSLPAVIKTRFRRRRMTSGLLVIRAEHRWAQLTTLMLFKLTIWRASTCDRKQRFTPKAQLLSPGGEVPASTDLRFSDACLSGAGSPRWKAN